MYVVYYVKDNKKDWMRFQSKEKAEQFIKDNDLLEYQTAIDDFQYERAQAEINGYRKNLEHIQKLIGNILR